MNTTGFVRINISLPADLVSELKKVVPPRGVSRFLANAARERIAHIEREKALKELLDAPPTFTFLKGKNAAVKWVRALRKEDNKRLERIWKNSI